MIIKIDKIILDSINMEKTPQIYFEDGYEVEISMQFGVMPDLKFEIPSVSQVTLITNYKKDEQILLNLTLIYKIFFLLEKEHRDEIFSLAEFKNKLHEQIFEKIFIRMNQTLSDAGLSPLKLPEVLE